MDLAPCPGPRRLHDLLCPPPPHHVAVHTFTNRAQIETLCSCSTTLFGCHKDLSGCSTSTVSCKTARAQAFGMQQDGEHVVKKPTCQTASVAHLLAGSDSRLLALPELTQRPYQATAGRRAAQRKQHQTRHLLSAPPMPPFLAPLLPHPLHPSVC